MADTEAPQSPSRKPIDALSLAALGYLAIPNLIFLFGWTKWPFAVVLTILGTLASARCIGWRSISWKMPWAPGSLALIAAVALAWSAFGGAGHIGYANPDWVVRDAVYGDLIFGDWPPSYRVDEGSHHILRSAIGYFLPPALLSKFLGLQAADAVLYGWTALGTFLFLTLLPLPSNNRLGLVALLLVVIFFSGMDFIGVILTSGDWPIFPLRMEWWGPFSYPSLSGQLFWAPNHVLPIWLATALLYRHWHHPDSLGFHLILLPLLPLWTPFALIGLAPFIIVFAIQRMRAGTLRLPLFSILFAVVFMAVVSRFMTIHLESIPIKTGATHVLERNGTFLADYATFVLLEFCALALALSARMRRLRWLLGVATGVLALLPFAYFGPSNDLLLRVSIPSLLIIMLSCLTVIGDWMEKRTRDQTFPWLVVTILLIGSLTPIAEMWRAATWRAWQPDYAKNLVDTQAGKLPPHYIGRLDSPDMLLLLREPSMVPATAVRTGM